MQSVIVPPRYRIVNGNKGFFQCIGFVNKLLRKVHYIRFVVLIIPVTNNETKRK